MELLQIQKIEMDMEYYAAIEFLARNSIDEVFFNSGENHALAVFVNLFDYVKNNVRIFSQSLCSNVPNSPEYVSSLEKFLKRGGFVNILLEENVSNRNRINEYPIFKMLKPWKNSDYVKIRSTDKKFIYNNSSINFSTADDFAYRIELDKEKRVARCNYRDSSGFTKNANLLFDNIFVNAIGVEI